MAIETGPPLSQPWEEFGWLSLPRAVTKLPPLAGAPGADEALGGLPEEGGNGRTAPRFLPQPPTTGFLTPQAAAQFLGPGGTQDPSMMKLAMEVAGLAKQAAKFFGGAQDVRFPSGPPSEPAATGTELLQTGVAGELPGGGGALNPAFSGTELLRTGVAGELAGLGAVSGPELLATGAAGEVLPSAGLTGALGNLASSIAPALPWLGALGTLGGGILNLAQGNVSGGAGTLGGGALGATIGSIFPGIGTLAGFGFGGGLGGLLGGLFGGGKRDIPRDVRGRMAVAKEAPRFAALAPEVQGATTPEALMSAIAGWGPGGPHNVAAATYLAPPELTTVPYQADPNFAYDPAQLAAARQRIAADIPDFSAAWNAGWGSTPGAIALQPQYYQSPYPANVQLPDPATIQKLIAQGYHPYVDVQSSSGVQGGVATLSDIGKGLSDLVLSRFREFAAPPAPPGRPADAGTPSPGSARVAGAAVAPAATAGAVGGRGIDDVMAQARATLGLPTG